MRYLLLCLVMLAFGATAATAQEVDTYHSAAQFRADARQVDAVAHVEIGTTVAVDSTGGYREIRLDGRVIESFKGRLRRGATITCFAVIESGYRHERLRGERVVFLNRVRSGRTGRPVLVVLENSTREARPDVLRALRQRRRSPIPEPR